MACVPCIAAAAQNAGDSTGKGADSAAARARRAPQPLAPVRVQARYQKRPSIYNFMENEPGTRSESISPVTTEWFDQLSAGNAAALLRAAPDLLVGADGTASVLGAPSSANQLQIDGIQVPDGVVTGLNGASVTSSPWDITIGGAAGATTNLSLGTPRPNHATYMTVESGIGGVPGWAGSPGQARGTDVPLEMNVGSSGPVGRFGYGGSAFLHSDRVNLPRWDRRLTGNERSVLDSVSGVLGAPVVDATTRSVQAGLLGRFDFVPFGGKRILALTSALTRSEQSGGTSGGFVTGSIGSDAIEDVGLLQLESKNVIQERVLWTSQAAVSISSSRTQRNAMGPTIVATDSAGGNVIVTGGAPEQPSSRVITAEGRSTGTWYSLDNSTRYVAQLQVRSERARLGGIDPHTTFTASSLDALRRGHAISLSRSSGSVAATASSFVFAPAFGARRDIGRNGSLSIGVRADAWTAAGVAMSGRMQHVDVSPRASLYRMLGKRSANRGALATLRVGAGRFTSWPRVQQWADAWAGRAATRELCTGSDVPPISLETDAPSCASGAASESLGGTVAARDLQPAASNRADISLGFPEIIPGVRAEFGAAFAQNDRIAAQVSPLMSAPVVARLTGDGGRTVLVPESAINSAGIVPAAAAASGVPDVTQLVSAANSRAVQWRARLGGNDAFSRLTWDVVYVLTTGRERSLAIAAPASAPSYVSGPLAAGGRHAIAFSLGTWIGAANIRVAGLLRSGVRFTPLADRDLNGDGVANDAAFIPRASSDVWANSVAPNVRSCIRGSAGRIAGLNSCTGPWSVTSQLFGTVPGIALGLPRGSNIIVEISNPLGAFAGAGGVVFGNVAAVNPTLVHITGFDAATHSFSGVPLSGFGRPLGLSSGITDPMRVAIGVQMPLGPSITAQRMDRVMAMLEGDSSATARAGAGMEYLGDLPPVPLGILQSADAIDLTADQRKTLQFLGSRWTSTASRLVLTAYGNGPRGGAGGEARVRRRMLLARQDFFVETSEINSEIRALLTPDQIDLLPSGLKMMLNPRFWHYISLQDAGDM